MATYEIRPLEVARITAAVGILSMGGDMQTFIVAPVLIIPGHDPSLVGRVFG